MLFSWLKMSRDMTKPTKWECAQRSHRSSAQSDQSLRYALNGSLRILAFFKQTVKTDQTGRKPRLIWVLAGCTATLLVLSCRSSDHHRDPILTWIFLVPELLAFLINSKFNYWKWSLHSKFRYSMFTQVFIFAGLLDQRCSTYCRLVKVM